MNGPSNPGRIQCGVNSSYSCHWASALLHSAQLPLMLPIHILGELAKPISLSCRLFGNIFGEDMLLVAFVSLGITSLAFLHSPVGLPLQLPFLFLALLTSTLQAAVFMVLSTIYVLLMLPHDEHHEQHEHEAHAVSPATH